MTPATRTSKGGKEGRDSGPALPTDVDKVLQELINDGRLPVGTVLTAGDGVEAEVTRLGLSTLGRVYPSVSDAAHPHGRHGNAWQYWRMPDGRTLDELRHPTEKRSYVVTAEKINNWLAEHSPPSARAMSRDFGLTDDRNLRDKWDKFYTDGSVLTPRPKKDASVTDEVRRTRTSRTRDWNGKSHSRRAQELRDAKKAAGEYASLIEFQIALNKAVRALAGWDGSETLLMDDVAAMKISEVYDDLVSLGEWTDRTLSLVQAWLGDDTAMQKIAKLRQTNGRTPEEADTARRLANRLERKLSASRLNGA